MRNAGTTNRQSHRADAELNTWGHWDSRVLLLGFPRAEIKNANFTSFQNSEKFMIF